MFYRPNESADPLITIEQLVAALIILCNTFYTKHEAQRALQSGKKQAQSVVTVKNKYKNDTSSSNNIKY